MTNEQAKSDLAEMMDEFRQQMQVLADVQRKRAELIGTGTAGGGRVTVAVNAEAIVIETRFSADIDDLTYSEIAQAMTEAAQAAAKDVASQGEKVMESLREGQSRWPKMSDIIEGLPDLGAEVPVPPTISTAPPNSPERRRDSEQVMEFTDVESLDDVVGRRSIADNRW